MKAVMSSVFWMSTITATDGSTLRSECGVYGLGFGAGGLGSGFGVRDLGVGGWGSWVGGRGLGGVELNLKRNLETVRYAHAEVRSVAQRVWKTRRVEPAVEPSWNK